MINRPRVSRLLLFVCILVIQGTALAQEPVDRSLRPSIRVTDEATVTVKPDQAEINIGVVTQAPTAQAAAAQNAQKQDGVISELRRMLGAGAEIKTISYSLNPNYRYPKDGGQPVIAGYNASNTVQVKTTSLSQVGNVIDLATGSGANNIQALRFTLKDETVARTQALQEASIKARAKAQAIASALGLKFQRILHVEEGGSTIRPLMEMNAAFAGMRSQQAPTPVESGSIDVRATITLIVEVAP